VSTAHASLFQQHPDEVPINECAAWRLAYRLGSPFVDVVAPTVLREINGEAGSLSTQQLGLPGDPRPFNQAPQLVLAAAFVPRLHVRATRTPDERRLIRRLALAGRSRSARLRASSSPSTSACPS
jgi:hypothetical protein